VIQKENIFFLLGTGIFPVIQQTGNIPNSESRKKPTSCSFHFYYNNVCFFGERLPVSYRWIMKLPTVDKNLPYDRIKNRKRERKQKKKSMSTNSSLYCRLYFSLFSDFLFWLYKCATQTFRWHFLIQHTPTRRFI